MQYTREEIVGSLFLSFYPQVIQYRARKFLLLLTVYVRLDSRSNLNFGFDLVNFERERLRRRENSVLHPRVEQFPKRSGNGLHSSLRNYGMLLFSMNRFSIVFAFLQQYNFKIFPHHENNI